MILIIILALCLSVDHIYREKNIHELLLQGTY